MDGGYCMSPWLKEYTAAEGTGATCEPIAKTYEAGRGFASLDLLSYSRGRKEANLTVWVGASSQNFYLPNLTSYKQCLRLRNIQPAKTELSMIFISYYMEQNSSHFK